MRTLCDVCDSAAAVLFCAADEAALCLACDDKVHKCNKLACRHVRVGLDDPVDVPRCDICEKSPAFFYCEIDGSSLCLQCDTVVHVGGKRTHPRYLLVRQRVKFPGDGHKPGLKEYPAKQDLDSAGNEREYSRSTKPKVDDGMNMIFPTGKLDGNDDRSAKMEPRMIDLNIKPHRLHGQDFR